MRASFVDSHHDKALAGRGGLGGACTKLGTGQVCFGQPDIGSFPLKDSRIRLIHRSMRFDLRGKQGQVRQTAISELFCYLKVPKCLFSGPDTIPV